MSAATLFTAREQTNGTRQFVNTSTPSGTLCDYYRGKPLDKNSPCSRPGCGRPWSEHYPEYKPKRLRGVIAEVCSVCAYPLDSDQHISHCRG